MEMNVLVKGVGDYLKVFNDMPGVKATVTNDINPAAIDRQLDACDAICLTGGSDVEPRHYGQSAHNTTFPNVYRDTSDIQFSEAALKKGKPIIGICRGAQLLCVTAGGSLIQDVTGHAIVGTNHNITTDTGENFQVTSTHHQMMHPVGTKNKRLAWAHGLSSRYEIEARKAANMSSFKNKIGVIQEPEVVWFPELLGLAVQYHPEKMAFNSRGRQYFYELLWKYIF